MIHKVKCFHIINEAGIPLLSYDPTDVANLISGSSAFSKTQPVHLEVLDSHTAEAKLQQYMNHELPEVQAGFRKGRGSRDQIANILWII